MLPGGCIVLSTLSTLTDIRDIVFIVFGITAVAMFIVTMVFTVLISYGLFALIRRSRRTVSDGLGPLLDSAQATMRSVRVTSEYMSEAAVSPVVGAYGLFAGLRRAVDVLIRRGNGR